MNKIDELREAIDKLTQKKRQALKEEQYELAANWRDEERELQKELKKLEEEEGEILD